MGRLWGVAVAGVVLVLGSSGATAQSAAVPSSWASYARLVGHQFQAWLMGDDDVAFRFHQFLEGRAVSATDTPPGLLLIKVWIGSEGQVTRLDFASPGAEEADAGGDLRSVRNFVYGRA